jgi:hypothetical protein
MESPFTGVGAAIPSVLWEALENALQANMLRLAKDVAKTLGQPHAPLVEALQAQKVRPYIFEESEDTREQDMRCGYICQRPDTPLFLSACGQAVLWNATGVCRCPEHLYAEPVKPTGPALPVLKRLDYEEEPLWVAEDGTCYDAAYEVKGRYTADSGKLVLFELVS